MNSMRIINRILKSILMTRIVRMKFFKLGQFKR